MTGHDGTNLNKCISIIHEISYYLPNYLVYKNLVSQLKMYVMTDFREIMCLYSV